MLRESQIGRRRNRSPLQNPKSYITAEKDAMQIDLFRNYLRPMAKRT